MADSKDVLDTLGREWEEFKSVNDDRLKKIEKGLHVSSDVDAKLATISKVLDDAEAERRKMAAEADTQRERLEAIEAKADKLGITRNEVEEAQHKHKSVFEKFVRSGMHNSDLARELKDMERKDVLIGVNASGGFALPEEISRKIEVEVLNLSPVRQLVKVVKTSTNDYKELVNLNDATAAWAAETTTRAETATPSLKERAPTMGELYAYPECSEWAMDDLFFDVEQFIVDGVSEAFASAEGIAVISGNGTNRPTGILNTTPVATDDDNSPLRSAEAIEFFDNPVSPSALSEPDSFIDLIYLLKQGYRRGAAFVMNSATLAAARKLADTTGQYLWQPNYQAGQPSQLCGYPVYCWEDMPDIGAGNFPVLFGNFKRGYLMADRVGVRMFSEPYTHPGYYRFYVRKRVGGIILNNQAIKALRT